MPWGISNGGWCLSVLLMVSALLLLLLLSLTDPLPVVSISSNCLLWHRWRAPGGWTTPTSLGVVSVRVNVSVSVNWSMLVAMAVTATAPGGGSRCRRQRRCEHGRLQP